MPAEDNLTVEEVKVALGLSPSCWLLEHYLEASHTQVLSTSIIFSPIMNVQHAGHASGPSNKWSTFIITTP